jgi:hypothetical protein
MCDNRLVIREVDLWNTIVQQLRDIIILPPKNTITEGRNSLLLAGVVLVGSDIIFISRPKLDFSLFKLTEKHV